MFRSFRALAILAVATLAVPHCGSPISEHAAALAGLVDGDNIAAQLLELAKLSDDANPDVTRVLFTEHDMKARQYVKKLMTDADLEIREDTMGNIWGRWPGSDRRKGSVGTGSHCDAIPKAGAYDGTLGVIGGIAALRALKATGFKPLRAMEVVMFTSEEPTRFGISCVGSRAMANMLSVETMRTRLDANGTSFQEAATAAGYGAATLEKTIAGPRLMPHTLDFFVELHIEQGPRLEAKGLDIGVVTAIAAPAALRVTFSGDGGHAGAQLMPLRNDASLAAAELALAVEKLVLDTKAPETVGTVGRWEIGPNAVNSVPRDAVLQIDVRDIDGPRRDAVVKGISEAADAIAKKRRVRLNFEIISQDPPATSSPIVTDAVRQAVKGLSSGVSMMDMVSHAYHDSLFIAQVTATAMIFVPCKNGWSHRPDEYASPLDIANGVRVLALTMAELAGPGPNGEGVSMVVSAKGGHDEL